jgi:hypothetical protein
MSPADAQRIFGVRKQRPARLEGHRHRHHSPPYSAQDAAATSGNGGHTAAEAEELSGGWGLADEDPTALFGVANGTTTAAAAASMVCDFDRVRAGELTAAAFERDYLIVGRPLILHEGARHMAAAAADVGRRWSRAAFFRRYGHEVFAPQKLPMWAKSRLLRGQEREPPTADGINTDAEDVAIGDYYAAISEAKKGGQRMYRRRLSWTNPRNSTLWNEMARDLSWPESLLVPTVRGREEGHFGLFMGPQGSGTSMHYHKDAWNALLFGRKLWVLTPPPHSAFRRHELAADSFGGVAGASSDETGVPGDAGGGADSEGANAGWLRQYNARRRRRHLEGEPPQGDDGAGSRSEGGQAGHASPLMFCEQQQGEVLFVPRGWGHATLNLRESIGVANFFQDEDAIGYRPSKIWHTIRGIRSLQTAAGVTAPSDMGPDAHP